MILQHQNMCGGGKYLCLICIDLSQQIHVQKKIGTVTYTLRPRLLVKSKHAFGLLESGPLNIAHHSFPPPKCPASRRATALHLRAADVNELQYKGHPLAGGIFRNRNKKLMDAYRPDIKDNHFRKKKGQRLSHG